MSSFISASHVFLDNPASTVGEVFEFLSDKAIDLGIANDRQAVLDAFKAREAMGSTGMNDGFAIPHAKTDAVKHAALVVVKFSNDIEWVSQDGEPIKAAIGLFAPASDPTTYLSLLSKIAVLLANGSFRATFMASSNPEVIVKSLEAGL